jgi:hypothetical protein
MRLFKSPSSGRSRIRVLNIYWKNTQRGLDGRSNPWQQIPSIAIKMKHIIRNKIIINKKYHTIGTVAKSNRKIVERDTIYTTNIQTHGSSLTWFGTSTSIKSGTVKLVFASPVICEPSKHCKCSFYVCPIWFQTGRYLGESQLDYPKD